MVLEIYVVPFYCSSFVHSSGIIAIDCYVLFSEDQRHTIVYHGPGHYLICNYI